MGGAHCPLFVMVGWEGLEPSTNALKGRCSTIELPTHRPRRNVLACFARSVPLKKSVGAEPRKMRAVELKPSTGLGKRKSDFYTEKITA